MFLARHGETEWNRAGRRQGQLDSPLTEDGLRQAQTIAAICSGLEIDKIFTSPLGRAYETANVIGSQLNCSVEVIDELAEVHHGTFAGLTNDEIEAKHPGELQRREHEKFTWTFPEGESYADAESRAGSALGRITAFDAQAPLLVTHEMVGRTLLLSLLGLPPAEALRISIPHGTVLEVHPPDSRGASSLVRHSKPTVRTSWTTRQRPT